MKSHEYITQITNYLERLITLVRLNNSVGLTDINSASEDFFAGLLNIIYGTALKNLNIEKSDFPAIDLGDKEEGLCFQVTSTNAKQKIEKTISKFGKHGLFTQYSKLKILVIVLKKAAPRTAYKNKFDFAFTKEDVVDMADLLKQIMTLDIEKQRSVLEYLQSHLDSNTYHSNISNETQTLIDLIDYLSSNKSLPSSEFAEEPDPERKIRHRFSEHSKLLEDEIKRLIPMYAKAKAEVLNIRGYTLIDSEHIKIYLQNESSLILSECNNNPQEALQKLTEKLSDILSKSGKKYDSMAIRFFIIDELVRCNVFPN